MEIASFPSRIHPTSQILFRQVTVSWSPKSFSFLRILCYVPSSSLNSWTACVGLLGCWLSGPYLPSLCSSFSAQQSPCMERTAVDRHTAWYGAELTKRLPLFLSSETNLTHFDAVILKMAHTGDKQDAWVLESQSMPTVLLVMTSRKPKSRKQPFASKSLHFSSAGP